MRRFSRLAAVAALSVVALSCSEAPTESGSPIAHGRIALSPSFSPSAALAFQALTAFGIEVTSVHIVLTAPDGSTRDTIIAFPSGTDTLRIDMSVPIRTAGQSFRADLELRNAEGQVLFSGTQNIVAQASTVPGRSTPAIVEIRYTGPGATTRTVTVSPATATLNGPGSAPLTASAVDAAGLNVSDLLVRWTSSDETLATVSTTGNTTATVTSAGRRGAVTISAITPLGVTGTTRINLVPLAARVVVISGGGQTGAAGSPLAQPLVVEVQAADNLPVSSAPVAFRAITAGGSVGTATAVTDANGRASTTLTLGRTAGAYQFEAVSGALTPVTATETATPAPAASIVVASGNGQSGTVATALAQPLAVRVLDQFGATVANATVQWAKVSGGGTLASTTSTTNASGIAVNTYTLGTVAGPETLRASLSGVSGAAGEANFSATAIAGPPATVTGDGGGQRAPGGTALTKALVIRATDAFGNPVVNVDVVWRVAAGSNGSATFSPAVSKTTSVGTALTNVTLGTTPGPMTIQAIVGTLIFNFAIIVDPPASAGNPGTISGFVYNAVSGAPLAGVQVDVVASLSPDANISSTQFRVLRSTSLHTSTTTVTTASDGRFTTPQLPAGDYDLTFTINGFVTTYIVALDVNGNTVAEAVPLVPSSPHPGTISGRVIDATTGQNISGASTVELRAGMSAITGTPIQTLNLTSANYQFDNVAAGTYTVLVRANGYADAYKTGIAVGATTTSNQNIFISPVGSAGAVRIVLTWRSAPNDLDSYLTGPQVGSTSRFTVYYGSQGSCTSAPFACLDQDVTSGFGPETMSISQVLTGRYRYSVNDYSNRSNSSSTALSQSGARVDVYISNVLAHSFSVPAGAGTDWTVFDLDGTTITPINTVGGPNRSLIPISSGTFQSRAPSMSRGATIDSRDDSAVITEAIRSHPKRR